MSGKHNKKRNSGLLCAVLLRIISESVVDGNKERRNTAIAILRESFGRGTKMADELSLYNEFKKFSEFSEEDRTRFYEDVQRRKAMIDERALDREKSATIKKINKSLGKESFSTFVPNYKSLATVYQLFNAPNFKSRVILEQKLTKMLGAESEEAEMKPIDERTLRTFAKKFNERYGEGSGLLAEQRHLLSTYVMSISDGQLELKTYLNEEIGKLKGILAESVELAEIKEDPEMLGSVESILGLLEEFKVKPVVDREMVETVLKIQELAAKELTPDGD